MIHKTFIDHKGQPLARVTFTLPNSVWADAIYLVGDFNDWNRKANPLRRNPNGEWSITIDLEINGTYHFRYLCDNTHWINDSGADAYITNLYNADSFVVVTDPNFRRELGQSLVTAPTSQSASAIGSTTRKPT
jgi:hypothetical protein